MHNSGALLITSQFLVGKKQSNNCKSYAIKWCGDMYKLEVYVQANCSSRDAMNAVAEVDDQMSKALRDLDVSNGGKC